jgi:hypothetical protein
VRLSEAQRALGRLRVNRSLRVSLLEEGRIYPRHTWQAPAPVRFGYRLSDGSFPAIPGPMAYSCWTREAEFVGNPESASGLPVARRKL